VNSAGAEFLLETMTGESDDQAPDAMPQDPGPQDPGPQDPGAEDPCPVGMRGIVPSLNTPFDREGQVDEAAVRRLVETTIATGCQGVLAVAVAGEQASLAMPEKDRIARIITETVARRVPVIISVTSDDPQESRQLSAIARAAGADGICCQAPAGLNRAELADHFAAVADAGPDLLMIQDLDWGGGGLAPDIIVDLFETLAQFRCLKIETVPAGPKYSRVLEMTEGRLHVSGGWAVSQMIDALDRNVHAFMPTAMDPVYVAIHRAHRSGKRNQAQALFERLLPVLAFANQHIDVSIRFFKMLRRTEGVFSTDACRAGVAKLDPLLHAEAERLIRHALELQGKVAGEECI
jgi:4-hydroxy-tetrahydrodipicolinate synthase